MAAIEAVSSVPPHIQPPIAQVPSPITEASIPDLPIWRVSISCGMFRPFHLREDRGSSLLVNYK